MIGKIIACVVGVVTFTACVVVTAVFLPLILLDAVLALVYFLAHWLRHNLTRPPGDYYVKQYDRLNMWLKRKRQELAEQKARVRQ